MRNKIKLDNKDIEYLAISAKMTPAQRMNWLEDMRQFTLKTLSRQKLNSLFKLRNTT
jgi:hypothetical protein